MGTRTSLGVVAMMLALATAGAAAAQAGVGNQKEKKAARAAQQEPKAAEAQKEAGGENAPPKQARGAKAPEPAAAGAKAAPAEAEAGAAGGESAPAEKAAAAAEAGEPAAQPAGEPGTGEKEAGEPAGADDKTFFRHEQHPYRFLKRSEGRYFPGERTEARPTGPAPRIEPEPPRVRGDAGAAIGIGLSFEQDWNLDEGYDLFGEDDVAPRLAIWFSHDLLSFGKRTVLAGEIGVGSGMDEAGGDFDGLETSLQNTRIQVAAYLRHKTWSFLQPHLRLAGHVGFVNAQLDLGDEEHFEDDAVSGGGSLGAGFTVCTPTRLFENRKGEFASLSIGVLLEGGYTLASKVSFDLVDDEEADRIEVRNAPLGDLALSGPYFRSALVVRF